MPINFDGATSGNREDAKPNVPTSGSPQPVLDTSNNSNPNPGVTFGSQPTGNREGAHTPPVPTGGTIPEGSTDVCDPQAHR